MAQLFWPLFIQITVTLHLAENSRRNFSSRSKYALGSTCLVSFIKGRNRYVFPEILNDLFPRTRRESRLTRGRKCSTTSAEESEESTLVPASRGQKTELKRSVHESRVTRTRRESSQALQILSRTHIRSQLTIKFLNSPRNDVLKLLQRLEPFSTFPKDES